MSDLITNNLGLWTSAILNRSTAGRGNNGKQEAYGIKKLRELILELAVRGKLVTQDPSDEPASALLQKTIAEKKRLIKKKIIRNTKSPSLPLEPPATKLPGGWEWTNLYEIGEIGPRNDAVDDVEASFVPMPLISEKYGTSVEHEVRQWKEIKSGFTHFQEDDVVLAKITPCFQNGKSAVMRGLTNGFGAGTTELHVYRAINSCTVPEYVLIYLKSPGFILDGIPKMTGTAGQKRITRDYFAGNHFPLPPIEEQHRIVAKVDELMALCDQLEQQQTDSIDAHQTLVETLLGTLTHVETAEELSQAWARIADHFDTLFSTEHSIDQLKQTILQLAVMGKLVPQDPNDEPASVLQVKIGKEKEKLIKEGKIRSPKPLVNFQGLDDLKWQLPDQWVWTRLADIADIVRGGSPRPAGDPRFYGGDIPFLKVADVTRSRGKMVEGHTYTIKEAGLQKTRFIDERTILLTNSGATLGVPAICDFPATFNDGIAAFVELSTHIFDEYLYLYLKSLSKWFIDIASRGQGQPNLNTDIIKATWFALPPQDEQQRIVVKVDELMFHCDTLKARLTDAQATQIHLADAIVEQAVV